MAKFKLKAESFLSVSKSKIGKNQIVECSDITLISVSIPQGGETKLANRLKSKFGFKAPSATISTISEKMRAIKSGADQYLLFVAESPENGTYARIRDEIEPFGYTTEQTDAWIMLEISGPQTIAALERICPLNLDASVFPVDAFARTHMEHMGALIIRIADEKFLLCSASSSANSFFHAIETSYRNVELLT